VKNKDLIVVGGIGLLAYMLMSKPQDAKAEDGGITSIIPLSGAGGTPLNISELFAGMASMFSSMSPEITNIFTLPSENEETNTAIFDANEWERKMKAYWDSLVNRGDGDGGSDDETIIDEIIDTVTPNIPNPFDIFSIFGGNGDNDKDGAMVTAVKSGINVWDKSWDIVNDVFRGKLFAVGKENVLHKLFPALTPEDPYEIPEAFVRESEAIFEEAGFSEILPSNLDIFIKARETITGEKAEILPAIGTPDYLLRMLGSPKPYTPKYIGATLGIPPGIV